jgi:hypothetical protein
MAGDLDAAPDLEQEQFELLTTICPAYRAQREPFFVLQTVANPRITHRGFSDGTYPLVYGDLPILSDEGLFRTVSEDGSGNISTFQPTPRALALVDRTGGDDVSESSRTVARTESREIRLRAIEIVEGVAHDLVEGNEEPGQRAVGHMALESMRVLRAYVDGQRTASVEEATTNLLRVIVDDFTPFGGKLGLLGKALSDVLKAFGRDRAE